MAENNGLVPAGADNGLTAGASSASQVSLDQAKEAFDYVGFLGKIAAKNYMAQNGIQPGQVVNGNMPAIPTTGVAPMQKDTWQNLPVSGGGMVGAGNRREFNKTSLINMIGSSVTEALNKKKERDQFAAQRQYEIIMTAMAALKTQKPGSPEYQHNVNILNEFFSDDKKVKKLEKILGFDAFDPKKEQQKQQDPDYQALHNAASNVENNNPIVPTGAITRTPGFNPSPEAEKKLEEATGTKAYGGAGTLPEGLNPNAAKFLGKMPVIPTREYIPSDDEIQAAWRVDKKIDPDGNKRGEMAMKMIDFQKDYGVQILKNMSDRDTAVIRARTDYLTHFMDNQRATQIALLEHGDKIVANTLKAAELQISRDRLNFDITKDTLSKNQEQIGKLLNAYSTARDAAQKQLEMAQTKLTNLINARKEMGSKFGGDDKKFAEELRAAYDEANDRAAKVDSYSKLENDIVSQIYKVGFPDNGTGKSGADVVGNIESKSKPNGSSGGSSDSKSAGGTNPPAAKPADSGGVSGILAPIWENHIKPFIVTK